MYNGSMEMEPFILFLNEKTNNEYKFSLKSAVLDSTANFCVIEILYKDGIMLDKDKKDEIENIAKEILPKSFKYEFVFIKNYISEERIKEDVSEYMHKNFPSVSYNLESVVSENKKFDIKLKIDNLSLEHTKQKSLNLLIEKHLKSLYDDYDYKCEFFGDSVYVVDEVELLKQNYTEEDVDMLSLRKIEISDIVPLVGEEFETQTNYIKDYTSPVEGISFCGRIRDIKPIVIKRKPKPKIEESEDKTEELEESNENITKIIEETAEIAKEINENEESATGYQRKLYKFTLEDFTGSVSCVFFSNKENQAKLEKLEVGSEIIVKGDLEEDKYSGGVSLRVKELGYCKLPETFKEYIVYHKEKPFYEFVSPEPYVSYQQDNLMNFMDEKPVPEFLKGKTFVCFDFETTGTKYYEGDKVIEIGAVKIVDGKITEKFQSMVDPEGRKIDPKAQEVNKITEEELIGAPLPAEMLQDFYKFAKGSTLIGHNIKGFDMIFLVGEGNRTRWNFDNEVLDTLELSRKYIFGVKNYKLGTLCEKLGIKLENAHRAIYDTIANAELFIKICEMM